MMIFNSFTVANYYNFASNYRTAAVVAFSCREIKLFKIILLKRLLNLLSLFTNKSTKKSDARL